MENNDDLYKSLITLLKMFKNRPYHLAKYMVDNSALNPEFIKKIISSDKLKEISDIDIKESKIYFTDISQMNKYYNDFTDDINQISKKKEIEELTKDINEKLDNCISSENYEDASRVRDYMIRNGIKRLKK